MLPDSLLPQISPAAAKVYLVLVCVHRRQPQLPTITISLASLASLSALSMSTCKRSLRELYSHHLLQPLPRKRRSPGVYLFLRPLPAAGDSSSLTPLAPPISSSLASPTTENPFPDLKNPIHSPVDHQSNIINYDPGNRSVRTLRSLSNNSNPNSAAQLSVLLAQLSQTKQALLLTHQESRP